ncbi:MAG: hypothetical protein ABSC20_09680 [Candidatus Bathyarchaeia archaeon]
MGKKSREKHTGLTAMGRQRCPKKAIPIALQFTQGKKGCVCEGVSQAA